MAARLLADWDAALSRFGKVMPKDYKRVLLRPGRPSSKDATSTRP